MSALKRVFPGPIKSPSLLPESNNIAFAKKSFPSPAAQSL